MTNKQNGRVARALIARLIASGWIAPGEYRIERTYAGREQRSEGAWSWYLVHADSGVEAFVGSQWSATECLAADDEHFAAIVCGHQ